MTETNTENSRYLVVFNPVKNRRRRHRLGKVISALKSRGLDWELYPTEAGLAANLHYFNNHLADFTDLIILGGDGTFNLVINCLQSNPSINVGLLPAGTGNDFARKWYAGKSFNQQLECVLSDSYKPISLGVCIRHLTVTKEQTRYFHNSLGTGFDASIAKKLTDHKSLFQSFSYTAAALRYIPQFKAPFLEFSKGAEQHQYQNFVTVFANSSYFGGGLKIAPMSDPAEPRLDMIWAESRSLLQKVKLLLKLLVGRHMSEAQVRHQTLSDSEFVEIKTPGLDLQVDGEYIGTTPCQIKVADFRLNLKSAD